MALDQIRLIRDCERECLEKKKSAVSNARHIVAGASKEADAIISEAKRSAAQTGEEMLTDARAQGEKEYGVLIAKAKAESEKMISSAQKNTDAAVAIIIKRVVSIYGNS